MIARETMSIASGMKLFCIVLVVCCLLNYYCADDYYYDL